MNAGGRSWERCVSVVALLVAVSGCREKDAAPKPPPAVVEAKPAAPPAPKPVSAEAALVERGRYLGESVLGCVDCHTQRDTGRFGGPLSGPQLAGACFGPEWDLPGTLCAPNITSDPVHGVGKWTDAQLLRTLREGYGQGDRTLFPMMPYMEWRATLSDGDAKAVVAWLRTVPAVALPTPPSKLAPEVLADIKDLAGPLPGPVAEPAQDEVSRGRYLATIAQCAFCHASADEEPKPFAGGRAAPTPLGEEPVPSLLPEGPVLKDLGEDAFVARFTAFKDLAPAPSKKGQVNKLSMPWRAFSSMKEEDLRAVYRFLKTQGVATQRARGP
ncbi:Cytochrome c [Myxococcus fulvus]|uniref:Cytochrome c n=1 Tax=Myxococcus fulvus TaxID=33 RepID=A0ABY1CU20_MYXFU|nr:Cytochrome c [Myxococcus fulvus]